MKYRIKEYTNKYGNRTFQIQTEMWTWGWVDYEPWFNTKFYSLKEAESCVTWIHYIDKIEAENKAKPTEYHYK